MANEFVEKYDDGIIYLGNDGYINEILKKYSSLYGFNYIHCPKSVHK